jgi:hypothetical protein
MCLIICTLLFSSVFVSLASAQSPLANYYATIKPISGDSTMYTAVGRNLTLTFQAIWTYGSDEGQAIQNAAVAIKVTTRANQQIETLSVNSATGTFSFNYSSSSADILTFTPVKLTTEDGKNWNTAIVDSTNNVYGLQAESAVVWWDTFQVSILSSDTGSLGKVGVSVNVTYLLLPEGGLTLPAGAGYNNATFLSKIAQDANVTINGINAKQTQIGVFTVDSSTFLPTAYVNVHVSQEGWSTTSKGFSFAQNSNQTLWIYGLVFILGFALVGFAVYFVKYKRAKSQAAFKHQGYPFFGGILLAVTSTISLYWGIVGLEGTLHTFSWIALGVLGVLTFVFGIAGSIMALRKRNQSLVIFAVIIPMIMNLIGVKASFDLYGLANPWLIYAIYIMISVISGYFLCNSDQNFKQANSLTKNDASIQLENPSK